MKKKNIIILFGGESNEHEVSCISALSVYKHIDQQLFTPFLIGITKKGLWFFQSEVRISKNSLDIKLNQELLVHAIAGKGLQLANGKLLECDLIFPVLHGPNGEDGTVQGLLSLLHIPFAGSGVVGSAVGMDKVVAKRIWDQCQIPVVPFIELNSKLIQSELMLDEKMNQIESSFDYPIFIKPVNAGSSMGASKAKNRVELRRSIKEAFGHDQRILIEICIDAREIECAVLGNSNPIVFFPGEINTTHDFYDYNAKYNDPEGALLKLRADISKEIGNKIMEFAKRAYSSISATGFARVDFFIDRNNQAIYLNEINTLPGFTQISMFPKMCAAGGMQYSELITKIIELGLE